MKPEMEKLIRAQTEARLARLGELDGRQRTALIELLIEDFFVTLRRTLAKWATLTGQSAQIDTGYIAQHMASVTLGIPGQGFKGKGLDLVDESEVKSAALLGGVDRPRWNHDLGTLASDTDRERRGLPPKWASYLTSPHVFYVLFDPVHNEQLDRHGRELRVRAWCLDAQRDDAWRDLLISFIENRSPGQFNLQLHPPVAYDDDIVVNMLGNLDMADVKVFEARFIVPSDPLKPLDGITWVKPLPDSVLPVEGRTRGSPYEKGLHPSRLEGAAEAGELKALDELFPGLGLEGAIETADPTSALKDDA